LELQRKSAEIWVNDRYPASRIFPPIAKRARQEKIRIAYYSADYHNHATAYLMAELFELHDRNRFELVAFSFGPHQKDDMSARVSSAFDRFVDVRDKSDAEVAQLSRDMEVDIAIDLKGFTADQRAGIFALRAAPIQVSFIGYPGTMGADYMDYLIADHTLIPEVSRQCYTEKIAYLPNSYQVNDRKRVIADKRYTREELGLPPTGFVYCCFNNNYKITPDTFEGWMRILKQVQGSVLWLLEDNPTAANNLRKEAEARGVGAQRLIFAPRMPLPEHLARHRAADLFMDTLPCNAHTTASDALWAGLPVLTCAGESFASRVAASLLTAIDLPELVTTTQEQYETLAIDLATKPEKLAKIGGKLEANRFTTPLFDTVEFVRHIEAAYTQIYERYQADLPPDHIHVPA
jgi:predicted O-linked N-acetylglucosamine transferase (SPINDLY family)